MSFASSSSTQAGIATNHLQVSCSVGAADNDFLGVERRCSFARRSWYRNMAGCGLENINDLSLDKIVIKINRSDSKVRW